MVRKLDFIVLGTARAGTTFLYHLLKKLKETWFFDGPDYERGLSYYFSSYFPGEATDRGVWEEVASSYLFVPYVPKRIYNVFPEIKLIAILRDPVDRAVSDSWMLFNAGVEPLLFEYAVQDNKEKILVIQFERFVQNLREIEKSIFKFIGVDPDVPLTLRVPRNITIPSASLRRAEELMRKSGILDLIPKDIRITMRKVFERGIKKKVIPPVSESLLQQLRGHFRGHIKRLAALCSSESLDLSMWMSAASDNV